MGIAETLDTLEKIVTYSSMAMTVSIGLAGMYWMIGGFIKDYLDKRKAYKSGEFKGLINQADYNKK